MSAPPQGRSSPEPDDGAVPRTAIDTSTLFEAAGVGLCLLDPEGVILQANDEWLRIAGLTRAESLGATIWALFPGSPPELHQLHAQVRAGARLQVPPHRQLVRGREIWYEGTLSPVPLGGGVGVLVSAIDVTERRRTEEALRTSEEKLRLAKEAARMGAWDWDVATGELVWTERCKALFGLAPQTAMSYAVFLAAVHPDDRERVHASVRTALSSRGEYDVEMRVVWPDGSLRWIESKGRATYDERGRPVRMAGMALDVTERKRIEQELREANERLREVDRRKDEFLGVLSHELRNPLAPIRNAAYILEHAAPGCEEAERARSVLRRQAEHLTRLVDDLLDVNRVTRGKIALLRARVSLRDLVLRAADDFRPAMLERGVELRVELPAEDLWAHADAARLNQVISNLLHNASKFTRRGDEVALSLRPGPDGAELRVRDTGAGIEAGVLPHIFEAFVQADRTLARSEGGLGLGLALVKGIVELHGGRVRAESPGVDEGAEFVVSLPLAEAALPAAADRAAPAAAPIPGRRVLVVDDNEDAAESLADLLRLGGHEVAVVLDGRAAVEQVASSRPEVVLCDIGLPGMDGYQVARAIRASGRRSVRLVALSGYAQAEDVRRALEAGFDAHLAKPPDPDALERLLA